MELKRGLSSNLVEVEPERNLTLMVLGGSYSECCVGPQRLPLDLAPSHSSQGKPISSLPTVPPHNRQTAAHDGRLV